MNQKQSPPSEPSSSSDMTLTHFIPTSTPATVPPSRHNSKDPAKGEASFKCEHCGRGFLFKNNLKAHLRTHTRDRKYTCDICQKSFIYKESLKNHMLLHSNELPYTCDICGKKFRDRSNRRKHVKNVHKYVINQTTGSEGTAPIPSSSSSFSNPTTPEVPKPRRKRTPKANGGRKGSKSETVTSIGVDPLLTGISEHHLHHDTKSSIIASEEQHSIGVVTSTGGHRHFSHHEYQPASHNIMLPATSNEGVLVKRESEEVWPVPQYPHPHESYDHHSHSYQESEPPEVKPHLMTSEQYSVPYLDQYQHQYHPHQQYWNTPNPSGLGATASYSSSSGAPPAYHLLNNASSISSVPMPGYSTHAQQQSSVLQPGQSQQSASLLDNQNVIPVTTTTPTNGTSGGSNPVFLYKDLSQFDFSYL